MNHDNQENGYFNGILHCRTTSAKDCIDDLINYNLINKNYSDIENFTHENIVTKTNNLRKQLGVDHNSFHEIETASQSILFVESFASISLHTIARLDDDAWYNDEIINAFIGRFKNHFPSNEKYIFFDTFFAQQYINQSESIDYDKLTRRFKKHYLNFKNDKMSKININDFVLDLTYFNSLEMIIFIRNITKV